MPTANFPLETAGGVLPIANRSLSIKAAKEIKKQNIFFSHGILKKIQLSFTFVA
jgi:hypothetical protein